MAQKQRINADSIKQIARQQMQENGTAGISLRAIARKLGVTAPAIYNYFPRMDDLITALIIDAFNGLADAVDQVAHNTDYTAPLQTLECMLIAYREWAITHPTDFQLIYGNPIPAYEAPADITVPLASRPLYSLLSVIQRAIENGDISNEEKYNDIPDAILEHLANLPAPQEMKTSIPLSIAFLVIVGWSRIHGMIMLEIFDHSPPVIGEPESFYIYEVQRIVSELKHY